MYYYMVDRIIELATQLVNEGYKEYNWLMFADKETLPYLNRSGEYKDLHSIDITLTPEDKDKMEGRAMEAIRLLKI